MIFIADFFIIRILNDFFLYFFEYYQRVILLNDFCPHILQLFIMFRKEYIFFEVESVADQDRIPLFFESYICIADDPLCSDKLRLG